MKTILLALAYLSQLLIALPAAAATDAQRPELFVGERWSWATTDIAKKQESKITREVTAKGGADYSVRFVIEGESGVSRPEARISFELNRLRTVNGEPSDSGWLRFPLTSGKKWEAKELWVNPMGNVGFDEITYTVVGTERITVPAGTFDTIKVSGEGWWQNVTANITDKVEITNWYAPEVKSFVRSIKRSWYRGKLEYDETIELIGASVRRGSETVVFGEVRGDPKPASAR